MVIPGRLPQGLVQDRVHLFSNVSVRFLWPSHCGVPTERATNIATSTHLLPIRRSILRRRRSLRWDSKVLALRVLGFTLQVLGLWLYGRASA